MVTFTETIDGRAGGSLKPTESGRAMGPAVPRLRPFNTASPAMTHRQPRVWYHSVAPVGLVP